MKFLKYTLISVSIFDFILFFISQLNTNLFLSISPPLNNIGSDYSYPRLVGFLILSLGLSRMYGGLFIKEKGAFIISIWSWIIELIWVISSVIYGMRNLSENLIPLVLAPILIIWSLRHYQKYFKNY